MRQLFVLILSIALIGVTISSCNNKKKSKKRTPKVQKVQVDTVVQPVVEEPVVEETPVVEEEVEVIEENTKPQKYFIVKESFESKKNAEAFSEKLKAEGYDSRVLLCPFDYYRVTYKGFTSKKEALRVMREDRKKEGFEDVWVYIYLGL
ncbi:MAG: SPOR domain-containing protein [Marinifilaceae bacterium]|jgi:cell division protein FtsN|nr:SPOR domain-containing protein [Marinifilaceae bacterium]